MKRRRGSAIDGYQDKSISWTKLACCMAKYRDSTCKNGLTSFEDNQAALVKFGIANSHPCLILQDVFRTDAGKAYIDRLRHNRGNGELGTHSSHWREQPVVCRDKVSAALQATTENGKRSIPLSGKRFSNVEEMDDKESRGIGNREKVVDCDLKVSWNAGCDDFSPARKEDQSTSSPSQVRHSLNFKKGQAGKDSHKAHGALVSPERGASLCRTSVHRGKEEGSNPTDMIFPARGGNKPIAQVEIPVIDHILAPRLTNCKSDVSHKRSTKALGQRVLPQGREDKCNDLSLRRARDEESSHCSDRKKTQGPCGNEPQVSTERGLPRGRLHLDRCKDDEKVESHDEGLEQITVGETERAKAENVGIDHDFEDKLCSGPESPRNSPSAAKRGSSMSCKHSERIIASPAFRDENGIDQFMWSSLSQQKRRRDKVVSRSTGTDAFKGCRASVLHLSGDAESYRLQNCECLHLDNRMEDGELGGQDHERIQITKGAEPQLLTVGLKVDTTDDEDQGCSLSSSKDSIIETYVSGTIVVSSDEEDSEPNQHHFYPHDSQEDALTDNELAQDTDTEQLVMPDTENYPSMAVAFSELYCGRYVGKANGDMRITDQEISIPLTDAAEQVEVIVTMERTQLSSYSIWEKQKIQTWWSDMGSEGPVPASVLQFSVSKSEVAALQVELHMLSVTKDTAPDHVFQDSPVILLTRHDPLDGLEGALLRSHLDMYCFTNLINENDLIDPDNGCTNGTEDIQTPTSSPESTDFELRTDQDCTPPDGESNTPLRPYDEPWENAQLEHERLPEEDVYSELTTEDEQNEQEFEPPAETNNEKYTPIYTLRHVRTRNSYSVSLANPDSSWTRYRHKGQPHRLIQFPPPPMKGGICVTMDDLQCLDSGKYLNDVIIDFYLKYLLHNSSDAVAQRCYIFSSFFYNQLARGSGASQGSASDIRQRQLRHQRVKNWTRHVDIFKKDFLFVPVNQESHWFLVIICFPGLDEPTHEAWNGPVSPKRKRACRLGHAVQCQDGLSNTKACSRNPDALLTSIPSDTMCNMAEDTTEEPDKDNSLGPKAQIVGFEIDCTEQTCHSTTVCKRPCIIIMDSLKLCQHQRVVKLLQEYLQTEWEVRRASSKEFGPDHMKSSCCQVPLQDNSTDCGLYLLQYVESFLMDPVVNFELPLHLEHWFSRQQMWTKRDEIRNVVLRLGREQSH